MKKVNLLKLHEVVGSLDSSVGIVTRLGALHPRNGGLIPGREKKLILSAL